MIDEVRGIVEGELMTTSEALRLLKISRTTLYRRMERRDFPIPVKTSKRTQYWMRSELESYIKRCEEGGLSA